LEQVSSGPLNVVARQEWSVPDAPEPINPGIEMLSGAIDQGDVAIGYCRRLDRMHLASTRPLLRLRWLLPAYDHPTYMPGSLAAARAGRSASVDRSFSAKFVRERFPRLYFEWSNCPKTKKKLAVMSLPSLKSEARYYHWAAMTSTNGRPGHAQVTAGGAISFQRNAYTVARPPSLEAMC
jgi:hypothetical protein